MQWIEVLANRAILCTLGIMVFGFDCFIADYFNRNIIFLVGLENNVSETLLINLLPVQAAISGIGIAIMALLTGLNKESFFGVSVTEYITNLKHDPLKHRHLIVLEIMLVMINFWSISSRCYNFAVYIFMVNILIVAWLVWSILFIFSNKFKIQEEMKQFLLEKFYNSKCVGIKNTLFYFSSELAEAKAAGNISLMTQDFNFLTDLYRKVLDLSVDENDFKFWHELYCSGCMSLLSMKRSDMLNLVIESIISIYKIDHKRNGFQKVAIHIWEDLEGEKVFQYFGCIKLSDMLRLYWNLKKAILENTSHLKEILPARERELEWFSSLFYLYALRKNKDDYEMFKYVLNELLHFYAHLDYFPGAWNKKTKTLFFKDVANLIRTLIDFKEEILITDIWENFFSEYTNLSRSPEQEKLQCIWSIQAYLYYIVLSESLTTDSERAYAEQLLAISKTFWGEFTASIFGTHHKLLTSELVEYVKNQVERWEKFELGKVKFLVASKAVEDFFFLHILALSRNFEQSLPILKKGIVSDIFRQYGDTDELNRLKKVFQNWQRIFLTEWRHLNDQTLNKNLKDIQSLLLRMQMKIMEEDIPKEMFDFSILQKESQDKCNDLIKSLSARSRNSNLSEQKFISAMLNCDRAHLGRHDLHDLIKSYILEFLERNCFQIFKAQLPYLELSKYDENVVEKLLDNFSECQIGDTVIGFPTKFFVNREENRKYTDYLEKYTKKITLPHGNDYIVILDSSNVTVHVSELSIEVCDSTEKNIDKDFTPDKGLWHYQFTGVKVSLSKEEKDSMCKFLMRRYCKLKISMTIEYEFADNSGMMIYFSNTYFQ
ncbi:MAG: hypothetical protein IJT06_02555 [Selenomonadaceae bacterium]|nr:hypothetical protein [Selenomonadaceae bacterium]